MCQTLYFPRFTFFSRLYSSSLENHEMGIHYLSPETDSLSGCSQGFFLLKFSLRSYQTRKEQQLLLAPKGPTGNFPANYSLFAASDGPRTLVADQCFVADRTLYLTGRQPPQNGVDIFRKYPLP